MKNLRLFAFIGLTVLLLVSGSMCFGIWLNKIDTKLPQNSELSSYSAVIDSVAWVEYQNTAKQWIVKFKDTTSAARLGGYSLEASNQDLLNNLKKGDSLEILYKKYEIKKGSVFQDIYLWWQFKELWDIKLIPTNSIADSTIESIEIEPIVILSADSARSKIISTNLSQAKILFPIWIAMLLLAVVCGYFSIRFLNQKK